MALVGRRTGLRGGCDEEPSPAAGVVELELSGSVVVLGDQAVEGPEVDVGPVRAHPIQAGSALRREPVPAAPLPVPLVISWGRPSTNS